MRRIDREIQSWSRDSARVQLALLWDEVERDGVRSISWWDGDPWASAYLISSTQPWSGGIGKWRAFCMINFGRPEDDEILFSDDREVVGRTSPAHGMGAREIRRMLELPGVEERKELCDLLIALGHRRDELDIPTITGFAGHEDRVVRYVVLAMLSWNPSIANDYLAGKFSDDPDPLVRELARRWSGGRLRRRTRA
ncbi:MAG TPA: HEAT repeat domain-containing protein [Solirubrobacterales bacterium]|nr:HEAT repeat domain-containing protein [Solirubrobacterales bacterium]HMY26821.1 HEAT repeat domain-containing protein [Solirubrobacterales bacterium]HNA24030.1 HEAT repeat domain-containing protein [Solirubrobacterales bacterium]HNA43843.1 HEAT repeat domain-containing protein [Solirubrobacterales bacterium]HNC05252.1 HEAT repeat domain-containing protein [Solirubrobacterales bacterium]